MILTKIAVMSLVCFGGMKALHTLSLKLFDFDVELYIDQDAPQWLYFVLQPIAGCIYCTASFWGSVAYVGMFLAGYGGNVFEWVVCVLATCGLNAIIESVTPEQE